MYGNNRKKATECLKYVQSRGFEPDRPAPVKSYAPNAWGLYDMHGNVWEWCRDWYDLYPTTAVTDPVGSKSGTNKVRRGGSWFKHGFSCRSANRAKANPATRFQTTGFRLIWSQQPDRILVKIKPQPTMQIGEQDGP
jgi:formylglycine-generating enzyme required for sulfatase activity